MGILALKTQKRTPKSQTNQRSGLALALGTLLALLNASRFSYFSAFRKASASR